MAHERELRRPAEQEEQSPLLNLLASGPLQLLIAVAVPVIAFIILWRSFIFMRDSEASRVSIGVVALVSGVTRWRTASTHR